MVKALFQRLSHPKTSLQTEKKPSLTPSETRRKEFLRSLKNFSESWSDVRRFSAIKNESHWEETDGAKTGRFYGRLSRDWME
jgi:hypothetical protein